MRATKCSHCEVTYYSDEEHTCEDFLSDEWWEWANSDMIDDELEQELLAEEELEMANDPIAEAYERQERTERALREARHALRLAGWTDRDPAVQAIDKLIERYENYGD